jgi:hypothetical protein
MPSWGSAAGRQMLQTSCFVGPGCEFQTESQNAGVYASAGKSLDQASAAMTYFPATRFQTVRYLP